MIITFAGGFVLSIAVSWFIATVINHTTYQINWLGAVGFGVIVAVLELIFPTGGRRKNNKEQKEKSDAA